MSAPHPPRVLIVDDSASSRDIITSALSLERYEIHYAENGQQALQVIPILMPDVVLLDQMMPGMTGVEVCRRVRACRATAEIPIVFITALDDRLTRMSAFEAGADDVVTKPVDRLEVRIRVRSITRLNRFRSLVESRGDVHRMLTEVRAAYDATIAGWARALELRDSETRGHSERVTAWALDLAREAGIHGESLEHIRRGALLHDIGKMGIPDVILLKPGPLSPEERSLMQQHPVLAKEWLSCISYLAPSIEIPYSHHEHWDGRGYPLGLAGDSIPYHARLFSVVDVFDALTSDRPYRKAWTTEQALAYLEEQAGKQFDPELSNLFVDMVRQGRLSSPG